MLSLFLFFRKGALTLQARVFQGSGHLVTVPSLCLPPSDPFHGPPLLAQLAPVGSSCIFS